MKKLILAVLVLGFWDESSAARVSGSEVLYLECQYPPRNVEAGTCKDQLTHWQKRQYNFRFECQEGFIKSGNRCLDFVNRFENNLKDSLIEEVYSYEKGNTVIYEKKKKVGVTSEAFDISRKPSIYVNKYGAKIIKYDLNKD